MCRPSCRSTAFFGREGCTTVQPRYLSKGDQVQRRTHTWIVRLSSAAIEALKPMKTQPGERAGPSSDRQIDRQTVPLVSRASGQLKGCHPSQDVMHRQDRQAGQTDRQTVVQRRGGARGASAPRRLVMEEWAPCPPPRVARTWFAVVHDHQPRTSGAQQGRLVQEAAAAPLHERCIPCARARGR
jgi:hypothetical protein